MSNPNAATESNRSEVLKVTVPLQDLNPEKIHSLVQQHLSSTALATSVESLGTVEGGIVELVVEIRGKVADSFILVSHNRLNERLPFPADIAATLNKFIEAGGLMSRKQPILIMGALLARMKVQEYVTSDELSQDTGIKSGGIHTMLRAHKNHLPNNCYTLVFVREVGWKLTVNTAQ